LSICVGLKWDKICKIIFWNTWNFDRLKFRLPLKIWPDSDPFFTWKDPFFTWKADLFCLTNHNLKADLFCLTNHNLERPVMSIQLRYSRKYGWISPEGSVRSARCTGKPVSPTVRTLWSVSKTERITQWTATACDQCKKQKKFWTFETGRTTGLTFSMKKLALKNINVDCLIRFAWYDSKNHVSNILG